MWSERPSGAELVEAVREFLERELLPSLEGSQGFHTRVAVNALKTVERELAEGEGLERAEHARLVALLGGGADVDLATLNERLIERIREGGLTERDPRLVEHLRATVLGKLAVDNPRYRTYQRVLERRQGAG